MQASIKRPGILTAICITGFLWIVFSFPAIFSPSLKRMGALYPSFYGLLTALLFISYIGIWHMKKWGVNLFAITFFTKTIFQILIDDVSYVGLALSVIFIVFFLIYYRRMDENL